MKIGNYRWKICKKCGKQYVWIPTEKNNHICGENLLESVRCLDCNWHGNVKDCDIDTEPDEFRDRDRKYPICPKCGGGIE